MISQPTSGGARGGPSPVVSTAFSCMISDVEGGIGNSISSVLLPHSSDGHRQIQFYNHSTIDEESWDIDLEWIARGWGKVTHHVRH